MRLVGCGDLENRNAEFRQLYSSIVWLFSHVARYTIMAPTGLELLDRCMAEDADILALVGLTGLPVDEEGDGSEEGGR